MRLRSSATRARLAQEFPNSDQARALAASKINPG